MSGDLNHERARMMKPRERKALLILIIATVCFVVEGITICILYRTAINEERLRLQETAMSQARLIEAIARFDLAYSKDYSHGDAYEATLTQVFDAHKNYKSFGKTGEFTLSKRVKNKMVFLLAHHQHHFENPPSVPFDSKWAEPMRLALSGQSGTIIGLDYRGKTVLAAYEPVQELDLGIVAKIDLAEIRAPFFKAALVSAGLGIIAVILGASAFIAVINPLIRKLQETIEELQEALANVKQLRGLLPICACCKKIRDDKGYWNQIESYVKEHSSAEFSHSICPDCTQKYYGDYFESEPHSIETRANDPAKAQHRKDENTPDH